MYINTSCTDTYQHTCTNAADIYICIHMRMNMHIHAHIRMHTYVSIWMFASMYVGDATRASSLLHFGGVNRSGCGALLKETALLPHAVAVSWFFKYTEDSRKSEHGCRTTYAGFPSFFGLGLEGGHAPTL